MNEYVIAYLIGVVMSFMFNVGWSHYYDDSFDSQFERYSISLLMAFFWFLTIPYMVGGALGELLNKEE